MKVGIYNFGDVGSPHLETHLELIEGHAAKGDMVYLFGCAAELLTCGRNPAHDLTDCAACVSRRKSGESLVAGKFVAKALMCLSEADRRQIAGIRTTWKSTGELEEFRIDKYDIGASVVAYFVSNRRDPDFQPGDEGGRVGALLLSCAAIYYSVLNHIRELDLQAVYVQCGRGAFHRAVLRACQKVGVECRVHERGHSPDTYGIWINAMPHTIAYNSKRMGELWEQADPIQRATQGAEFFNVRAAGKDGWGWFSFVGGQQPSLLPQGWEAGRRNIAIFTSSEDEMVGLGEEYRNPVYPDTVTALERIAAGVAARDNNIRLHVRLHPYLVGVHNPRTNRLRALRADNIIMIQPESPVSSYGLLSAVEKVLTFGSTVGIEAVYFGKPSILVGKALYQELGATYNAATHEEVIELLCSKLDPKPVEKALVYGFYYSTFGTPFKWYRGENYGKGLFKGVDLAQVRSLGQSILKIADRIPGAHFLGKQLGAIHRHFLRRRLCLPVLSSADESPTLASKAKLSSDARKIA